MDEHDDTAPLWFISIVIAAVGGLLSVLLFAFIKAAYQELIKGGPALHWTIAALVAYAVVYSSIRFIIAPRIRKKDREEREARAARDAARAARRAAAEHLPSPEPIVREYLERRNAEVVQALEAEKQASIVDAKPKARAMDLPGDNNVV